MEHIGDDESVYESALNTDETEDCEPVLDSNDERERELVE